MSRVYLALGSNLDHPFKQVNCALEALARLPRTYFVAVSPFYRSKPLGSQDQPDYLNAVMALDTLLQPSELLDCTQCIEQDQGRARETERWRPRTLDIDILIYGDQIINTKRLTVPHYDIKNREFMLYPLADLAPDLILPDGETLQSLRAHVPLNGLTRW